MTERTARCQRCHEAKPVTTDYWNRLSDDGTRPYFKTCRDCLSEAMRGAAAGRWERWRKAHPNERIPRVASPEMIGTTAPSAATAPTSTSGDPTRKVYGDREPLQPQYAGKSHTPSGTAIVPLTGLLPNGAHTVTIRPGEGIVGYSPQSFRAALPGVLVSSQPTPAPTPAPEDTGDGDGDLPLSLRTPNETAALVGPVGPTGPWGALDATPLTRLGDWLEDFLTAPSAPSTAAAVSALRGAEGLLIPTNAQTDHALLLLRLNACPGAIFLWSADPALWPTPDDPIPVETLHYILRVKLAVTDTHAIEGIRFAAHT